VQNSGIYLKCELSYCDFCVEISTFSLPWQQGLVWQKFKLHSRIWLSNGHATDDVTWPTKMLWGSTVGYPSDSLASCSAFLYQVRSLLYCIQDIMPASQVSCAVIRRCKFWPESTS